MGRIAFPEGSPRVAPETWRLLGETLRGTLFWLGAAGLTLALGVPGLICIALDRGDRAMHFFQRLWGRGIVRWLALLGVETRYEGLEHLPRSGAAVLVANHASLLDVFVLSAVQPEHTRWVVKQEVRAIPVVGWAIRMAGFVFVDRQGRRENVLRSFQGTEQLLSQPGCQLRLLFFPEGTRTRDGRLGPFKKGAFRIAVEHKLPVVPIALSGTYEALPRGWFGRLRAAPIRVRVLEPLRPESDPGYAAPEQLAERVRERVAACLAELASPSGGA